MRDIRRYHKQRFKEKARRIFPHDKRGILGDNLKACSSCNRCFGNSRKMGRVSKQERIAYDRLKSQCDEIGFYPHRFRAPKVGW